MVNFASMRLPAFQFNNNNIPRKNSRAKNNLAMKGAVVQFATLISMKENSKISIGNNLV